MSNATKQTGKPIMSADGLEAGWDLDKGTAWYWMKVQRQGGYVIAAEVVRPCDSDESEAFTNLIQGGQICVRVLLGVNGHIISNRGIVSLE